MNSPADLQHLVADWLEAEAPARAPDKLLVTTLDRVAVMPQIRVLWRRGSANGHRSSPPILVLAATLLALSMVGALAVFGGPGPGPSPSPLPASGAMNAWTAFMTEDGVYQVRQGEPARLVTAPATDGVEICLESGGDGSRFAYGRASGSDETGFRDAAVVVLHLDPRGKVTDTVEIKVGGELAPPCPAWAPDGNSLAFAAREAWRGRADINGTVEVWVVPLDGRPISKLPDRSVEHSLAWAPDSSRLAIANEDGIYLYAPDSAEQRTLISQTSVTSLTWSPDGTHIAYERGGTLVGQEPVDLVVHEIDTGKEKLVASGYTRFGPRGAVWSPNGDQIAYRRVCARSAIRAGGRCYEQHEVVLLSVAPGSSWLASEVSEQVLTPVLMSRGDGRTRWYFPRDITWSPDGNSLLYTAMGEPSGGPPAPAEITDAVVVVPIASDSEPVVLVEWGGGLPGLR